jgi:hypothetical protein
MTLTVKDIAKDMSDSDIMIVLQNAIADANDAKREEKDYDWREEGEMEEIEAEIEKNSLVYNALDLKRDD